MHNLARLRRRRLAQVSQVAARLRLDRRQRARRDKVRRRLRGSLCAQHMPLLLLLRVHRGRRFEMVARLLSLLLLVGMSELWVLLMRMRMRMHVRHVLLLMKLRLLVCLRESVRVLVRLWLLVR